MNKHDFILISVIIIIFMLFLGIFQFLKNNKDKEALVYYNNDLVLKIDLTLTGTNYYEVNGFNGLVKIEATTGKIRVIEEDSPFHICSKQGYISNSYEQIVCLPNKIIIKIESKAEVDTIVG